MKLLIVAGSQRRDSQTVRVANHVAHLVRSGEVGMWPEPRLLDLAESDDGWFHSQDEETPGQAAIRRAAHWCSGLVFVVPEWGGMVPPVAKNFFLLTTGGEIAHKPGLIVAVSGGQGGAYPVQELRTSSYKNTKICWIPEHVIVRDVGALALDAGIDTAADRRVDLRLRHGLATLAEYMAGLSSRHAALLALAQRFPYGM